MPVNRKSCDRSRQRAEVILRVRSGLLSAASAARLLGVSRKTYYNWEKRALRGMLDSLENRPPGRPKTPPPDPGKILLEKKVAELERKLSLAEGFRDLREMLAGLRPETGTPPPKPVKPAPRPKKKRT